MARHPHDADRPAADNTLRPVPDAAPPTLELPHRVTPSSRLILADVDPGATGSYESKADVKAELAAYRERIADLQARLYGESSRSVLVVLQAMDTGGKDGAIKDVFRGVNPPGLSGLVVQSAQQRGARP